MHIIYYAIRYDDYNGEYSLVCLSRIHDRMQCGVETSYAWLRKPNELVREFCQYHFHNFNGDIIYLMTLLQMILFTESEAYCVLHCTSWACAVLLCLVHYESVVPVIFGM